MTRKHYNMKLQEDALNGNIKNLTRKLMRKASTGPLAIGQILANPENPRNEEGELIWRHANSDAECLEGTAQQHTR